MLSMMRMIMPMTGMMMIRECEHGNDAYEGQEDQRHRHGLASGLQWPCGGAATVTAYTDASRVDGEHCFLGFGALLGWAAVRACDVGRTLHVRAARGKCGTAGGPTTCLLRRLGNGMLGAGVLHSWHRR